MPTLIERGASAMQSDLRTRRLDEAEVAHLVPYTPRRAPVQYERHIILSDLHYRNYERREWDAEAEGWRTYREQAHDPRALAAVEAFMQEWGPTHIHWLGDIIDCAQISRFDKEPQDIDGLQSDIEGVREILRRVRADHPRAEMDYELGNHEVRLQSYLRTNAVALRWLTGLTWQSLLDSQSLRMPIYPYGERVSLLPGTLEIVHGDKVGLRSGFTAHKMLAQNISGVSGHVHRLGMVFKTTRTGMLTWAESGCLCNTNPSYARDVDWQTGFVVAFVDRANNRFHLDVIPIISGRIVYAGQVYEA